MSFATWTLFAQQQFGNDDAAAAAGGVVGLVCNCIFIIIFGVIPLIGLWKIFEKAGKPGWAAIVPIYNIIVMLEIVNKPLWWIVLFIIPCANIIVSVIVAIELAKKFGQGAGFAIGMVLLPFVFYPLLGFSSQYRYQP